MKLTPNWKTTLTSAWSVRLLILAAVISVLPVFVSLVSPDLLGLDPLVFAGIAALVNLIAIPARILVQPTSGLWAAFRRDESGAVRKRTIGALAGGSVALASAISFIGQWEGLRTEAYRDIVGVWTICYGETKGDHHSHRLGADRYGRWPCLSARGLRLPRPVSGPRTRADRARQSTGSRPHCQRTRPRHPCQNPRGESPCGSCCRASLPWPSTPAPPQPPPLKAPILARSPCCCRSGGSPIKRSSCSGRGIGVHFWIVVGRSRCSVGAGDGGKTLNKLSLL